MTFKHNLGDKVKDRVSGLVGIVVSRSEHLFGCARYWVQPQEVKDGKSADGAWYDEDSIEVVKAGVIKPQQYRVVDHVADEKVPMRRAGGPSNQPASHARQTTR